MNNIVDYRKVTDFGNVLKCFANIDRLAILSFLKNRKPASVGGISDNIKTSYSNTSKHLLYLEKRGILVREYDGHFVMYTISSNLPNIAKEILSCL